MSKKLGTKIIIVAMVIIAAVVGSVLMYLRSETTAMVDDIIYKEVKRANDSFARTLEGYQAEALQRAEMIANSGDVIAAVSNSDNDALIKALKNLGVGLDLITLCDAQGTVLARTHSDKTGDSVLSQQAISTALQTGSGISTIEPGTVIGLSTRGSAAIKDADGNIIGALTCGHDLSQNKYVDDIKLKNQCEVTFYAGDICMSTTLFDDKGNRAVGEKANDDIVNSVIQNKKDYVGQVPMFGIVYSTYYSPVTINNGQVIGMLLTGINIDSMIGQRQTMILLIIVAFAMLLMAVSLTAWLINSTTRKTYWYENMLDSIPFPISVTDNKMRWTFINKPVEDMMGIKRIDVMGKPCSNWGSGICGTENCGINCLRRNESTTYFDQENMHFKVDVSYLHNAAGKKTGFIEVVQDITDMVNSSNVQAALVEQVRNVSGAFISASRQIADGAQSLADGSIRQSSSVEELSASISKVAENTKGNAEMANRAAVLASTIKDNAEKGAEQMDEMMSAVNEINHASQNIGKVIKVIDDIAFQTNILALNAAVEAARAGQHGKGFAVVAEEVRNLAAKSAEAARDTGALIANSIEKAELGSHIAGETAVSLTEIVNGINESSQLVSDIAKSSDEQTEGILLINKGIEQVAEIVHRNSATAQESAAAAEELSKHTEILEELLITNADDKRLLPPGSSGQAHN